MQKLWKVVLEAKGCTELDRLVLRLRFGRGTKVGTLDAVRCELARRGITNGGGKAYSRERVSQFVRGALEDWLKVLLPTAKAKRVKVAVAALLKQKRTYSSATEDDPYLQGRLQWRKLTWVRDPGVDALTVWERTVEYYQNKK